MTPSATGTPSPSPTGPFVSTVLTGSEASSHGPAVTEVLGLNGQGLTDLTLDLCGKNYPSDNKRADRLQVSYVMNGGTIAESNEIVKYQPGGAALAFAELTHTTCPKQFTEPNNDVVAHTTISRGGAGLLAMSVIVTATIEQHAGGPIGAASIYQFDGDYLDGVYVFRATVDEALHDALAYATLSATKLRALAGG